MGSTRSDWTTVREAAERLGTDPDSVKGLTEKGFIRKLSHGDTLLVHSKDIDDILKLRGGVQLSEEEMRREIVFLKREVARLKDAVDLLFQANQMAAARLDPMDDEALLQLFINVVDETRHEAWTTPRIFSCCELFLRISEIEIDRIGAVAETDAPWLPFYRLCLDQLKYVTTHPDFPIDIDLQRARDLLSRGRDNIRSIAIIMIELKESKGSSYELLAAAAATEVDAFDTLVKQMKNRCDSGDMQLL